MAFYTVDLAAFHFMLVFFLLFFWASTPFFFFGEGWRLVCTTAKLLYRYTMALFTYIPFSTNALCEGQMSFCIVNMSFAKITSVVGLVESQLFFFIRSTRFLLHDLEYLGRCHTILLVWTWCRCRVVLNIGFVLLCLVLVACNL